MQLPSSFSIIEHQLYAKQAAIEAGAVLRKMWGHIKNIQHKDAYFDLVTEADQMSEECILNFLHKHFPAHSVLSEEAGLQSARDAKFTWIVDPLDGTTNYAHQYPMVAVSIALAFEGTPLVGVVYNPLLEELFEASRGAGCLFNGKIVKVSTIDALSNSLLASGFPYDRRENPDTNYREFCHLTHLSQGVRRGGAASLDLAYVAAGRLEGYWERGLKPWDMAAGMVLVEEAGGKISAYDQSPVDLFSGKILASNGRLHAALSQEIRSVPSKGSNPLFLFGGGA